MSEERFEFSPEVFDLDDRKSVEAVIHLLDCTYEQEHTGKTAEDVLYDFCMAYLEEAQNQTTLSDENINKRLKVIVQWYAEHARTPNGARIIPEDAANDICNNWDEWLNGPEPLLSGLFQKFEKKKQEKMRNQTGESPVHATASKIKQTMISSDAVREKVSSMHVSKAGWAVIAMLVCFIIGAMAGWKLANTDKTIQLTIGKPAVESSVSVDKDKQTADNKTTAVMKLGMNVRSKPTTKNANNILTTLKKGDKITILSKADDDGWMKISCTDSNGEKISGYMQSVYDGETVYTKK